MKKIILTLGIILLIGLTLAGTQISHSIDFDKAEKDTLNSIGILEPVISSCIKTDNYTCKAKVYEKGGINKEIKVKTKYCETYVFEEVVDECIKYENVLGLECSNQLVYEEVCKEVEKQNCSWIQEGLFWNYNCTDYNESVCKDRVKQFCLPYNETQCTYEDVFIENCTIEENETVCNNILQDYKEKVCVDVTIANCTNVYGEVCANEVTGQNCIENSTKLEQTNECLIWKILTQTEIETEMKTQTEQLLNQIAEIQIKRSKVDEVLTDEIVVELNQKAVIIKK